MTLVQDDPTWALEYAHFKTLCRERRRTDLANDIWLNRAAARASAPKRQAADRRMSKPVIGYAGMTHLGLVSASAAAGQGFRTVCFDPDAALIARLKQGDLPVSRARSRRADRSTRDAQPAFTADAGALGAMRRRLRRGRRADRRPGQSDLASDQGAGRARAAARSPPTAVLVILRRCRPASPARCRLPPDACSTTRSRRWSSAARSSAPPSPNASSSAAPIPREPLPPALQAFLECLRLPDPADALTRAPSSPRSASTAVWSPRSRSPTRLAELCERDRRRLVRDRAGAEARPAHRAERLSHAPASASPAAISSATCARSCRSAKPKSTDAGVVRAWLANSAHRKDWAWQTLQDTGARAPSPTRRSPCWVLPTRKTRIRPRTRRRSRCSQHLRGMHGQGPRSGGAGHASAPVDDGLPPIRSAAAKDADVLMIATPWPQYRDLKPARTRAGDEGADAVLDPYRVLDGRRLRGRGLHLLHARHAAARAGSLSDRVCLRHRNTAPAPPARVVVLGAGGFVGGAIMRKLEAAAHAACVLGRKELDLLADRARRAACRRCCGRTMRSSSSRPARRARRRR